MAKKAAAGLAVVAGLGALMLAAGGSGGSRPRPVPSTRPPQNPGAPDEDGLALIAERVAAAVRTNDPDAMRAEARRLRAEGYTRQAEGLEELADEIEAKTKPGAFPLPIPSATVPTPIPATTKPLPAPGTWRDLVRGMQGEDVRAWQSQLRADGYRNIDADGDFGKLTFAATTEWQWERELKDDGIVGPKTRAAIGSRPVRTRAPGAVTPAPAPPATPVSTQPPAPAPAPAPSGPPAAPKPPVVDKPPAAKPPAATPAVGTVPALLVNVTLRKVAAPEPVDERVKLWQDRLLALGFRTKGTKSDGMFGPNTEKQTKALQQKKGLDPTGIADPITIATGYGAPVPKASTPTKPPVSVANPVVPPLLVNIASWRPVMEQGNKGQDVREWQQVLNRYGASLVDDGDFGPKTHDATKAWQLAHQRSLVNPSGPVLVPDGEVGKNTKARLAELMSIPSIVAGDVESVPLSVLEQLVPMSALVAVEQLGADVHALALELVRNLEETAPGDEDRGLVHRFQVANGLNATGNYGPSTAEALIPLGLIPPKPRWWPTKKKWRAQSRYRTALRTQAHRDPERSSEWLSAASAF